MRFQGLPTHPGLRTAVFLIALLSAEPSTGLHWVPVGPPGNPGITSVDVQQAFGPGYLSRLYAGVSGGSVLESDDGGSSWAKVADGLPGQDVVALASYQEIRPGRGETLALYAGTAGAGVYWWFSGPGGQATPWLPLNDGLTSLQVHALADSFFPLYAGTDDSVFEFSSAGWIRKAAGLPGGSEGAVLSLAYDPFDPARLYAGTGAGLFKSEDGGESWTSLDLVPGFKVSVSTIAMDPLAPSRLFVSGIANPACYPLCLGPSLAPSFAISVRSLDGGQTWSAMDGLSSKLVRAFVATSSLPARVFAGTTEEGVYESDDGGLTWGPSNDGLGNLSVSSLAIDSALPSVIYAGTAQGVFSAPLDQAAPACGADSLTLCLNSRRFSARIAWTTAGGATRAGQAFSLTDTTGAFWFFDPTNVELVVKVLDGRSVNGSFWVFYGSLTNVEFTLTVTDLLTGAVRTYVNPQGQLASFADTSAF
jgi:photosystem II stability/assembly factor-like uncharacterized protein